MLHELGVGAPTQARQFCQLARQRIALILGHGYALPTLLGSGARSDGLHHIGGHHEQAVHRDHRLGAVALLEPAARHRHEAQLFIGQGRANSRE